MGFKQQKDSLDVEVSKLLGRELEYWKNEFRGQCWKYWQSLNLHRYT